MSEQHPSQSLKTLAFAQPTHWRRYAASTSKGAPASVSVT
jgi:hypothetical protein